LKPALAAMAFLSCCASTALAQDAGDPFIDGKDGAKLHVASGFACPQQIDRFQRDAVGESDVETNEDFCAYSALDGVYGTIRLVPLAGPYDAKTALAPDFVEQEGTGGTRKSEEMMQLGSKAAPLSVYTRTYETAHAESMQYQALFAGSAVKNWAVEVTIEFATPRDDAAETEFLHTIYSAAQSEIAAK
jgi:hypothetical protein